MSDIVKNIIVDFYIFLFVPPLLTMGTAIAFGFLLECALFREIKRVKYIVLTIFSLLAITVTATYISLEFAERHLMTAVFFYLLLLVSPVLNMLSNTFIYSMPPWLGIPTNLAIGFCILASR